MYFDKREITNKFEDASERGGYQESGEFDENGEFGEFGDFPAKICQIANFAKFDERSLETLRFEGASEGGGYQESDEIDRNGEFGDIGDLTKVRRKDLDLRKRAKEGGISKAANLTKTVNLAKLAI